MENTAVLPKRRAVSLILKCVVVIAAAVGVYASYIGGLGAFMSGPQVFMFFTIQSNIAIALICAIGAVLLLTQGAVNNGWFILKFVGTVAITLTGAVFSFVLAPTLGDQAWNLRNILTHVVAPIAAIADFFVTGVFGKLEKKHTFFGILPPLAYVIYAAVAYVNGWEFIPGKCYPYFFLNWGSPAGAFGFCGELPYMGCVWWILIGMALILLLGLVYILILNAMKRRNRNKLPRCKQRGI
ncbi:MAG: Pr6Pr family membrane protein [Ruminococcus sp.]|nr:Pr6Pr family membrane protein [Ruminococcus sp.]